jgi:FMN phosphatase YigB (HAD superfamily)
MEKYKWDKDQIIFIDNDADNIRAAENSGITSLCVKEKEERLAIGDKLRAAYQERFAAT